jgi:alkanesulfonate monooxygenase
MKVFWFIPTHGDGRYLGTSYGGRPLDFNYLKQIACAVDNLGFYGALLPTGRSCEDASKIEAVRKEVARSGRSVRFGIRLHVIVRESDDAAWRDAESLISHLSDQTVRAAQQTLARHDSVSQQRMLALRKLSGIRRSREALEVSPNLWAGVGLVRGGAGTALVGSAETVAARMLEYRELGIETFILSGYPHLEEAFRVAELLFARLPLTHDERHDSNRENPFFSGEIVGNDLLPKSPVATSSGKC